MMNRLIYFGGKLAGKTGLPELVRACEGSRTV